MSRMKTLVHQKEFLDWVQQDYVMRKGRFFIFYVMKDAAGDVLPSQGDDNVEEDTQTSDEN